MLGEIEPVPQKWLVDRFSTSKAALISFIRTSASW
jgi:hypothetical protein